MSGSHSHGFGVFDPLTGIDSPVHRLGAGVKLAAALAMVLALALVPLKAWALGTVFPAALLVLVAVCGAGFVPAGVVAGRVLFLEPVILGAAGLAWFQPQGGLIFGGVVLRSSLCVATMVVLSCTTPFPAILAVLRRWGLPPVMVMTLGLMFRYLFLLSEESQRLRRARASRTFRQQRWSVGRWAEWAALAGAIGTLFVRTTERAERVYAAMVARGWRS